MGAVKILGHVDERARTVLTPAALGFLADLHARFNARRNELLAMRAARQALFDAGDTPHLLEETANIRATDWKVAAIPADLQDRRVEITGPVDRKMIINALNSGAKVYMADFEDATTPTWANIIEGQINLKDRWEQRLDYVDPVSRKSYTLKDKPAVLIVRPRGWHLPEHYLRVGGEDMAGALVDFGLYVFHNAKPALQQGSGPYFYLPKIESHLEARLWNEVFRHAETTLGLAHGAIKATVLIETLPAAFEMDEILFEMRERIVGLNCGRWDYIFSLIKRLGRQPRFLTPDRRLMTMDRAFLRAYSRKLIQVCHRRGALAIGGMAAQIPVKGDSVVNDLAFARVRADKEREAGDGHDGTWVAHPDLVPLATEVFDRLMPQKNQLDRLCENVNVTEAQMLEVHDGNRTEQGLRENIRVGVQYIEAWLGGRGAVPLYNLMEDAATAEICRAQIWQWLQHGASLDDGRYVTAELFKSLVVDEMDRVRRALTPTVYDRGRFGDAIRLFSDMCLARKFEEFLTLPAYAVLSDQPPATAQRSYEHAVAV